MPLEAGEIEGDGDEHVDSVAFVSDFNTHVSVLSPRGGRGGEPPGGGRGRGCGGGCMSFTFMCASRRI